MFIALSFCMLQICQGCSNHLSDSKHKRKNNNKKYYQMKTALVTVYFFHIFVSTSTPLLALYSITAGARALSGFRGSCSGCFDLLCVSISGRQSCVMFCRKWKKIFQLKSAKNTLFNLSFHVFI